MQQGCEAARPASTSVRPRVLWPGIVIVAYSRAVVVPGATSAAALDDESRAGMGTPSAADAALPNDDALPEALGLARGAAEASLGLKLLGGLAVRVLCPEFPPRLRAGQDMDFACVSKERKKVADWLAGAGCEPDRRFNNLNGDRQMYFNAPSGRPIDVMVDRLTMCHTLDFRPGF